MFGTNFGTMGINPSAANIGAFWAPPTIIKNKTRKSIHHNNPFYVGKNNIKPVNRYRK